MTARAGKAAAARPVDEREVGLEVGGVQMPNETHVAMEAEPQIAADRARGSVKKEIAMVSSFERAVIRIRHDLRERLLDESHLNVVELLDALEVIADEVSGDIGLELHNEAERWRLRFEMMAALQEQAEEMDDMSEGA
jgi:hypothetical protein